MKIILIIGICLFFLQPGLSQEKIYISNNRPAKTLIYTLGNPIPDELPQDSTTINAAHYFTIDTIRQKIFHVYRVKDIYQRVFSSMNLDGSDFKILKVDSISKVDLVIDYEEDKLLWIDYTNEKIMRADFDGSNIETVYDSLNNPRGLVYNHENKRYYWCEYDNVYSINKNGTDKKLLASNLGSLNKIVIDYETDKIYWTADEKHKIHRINYDGSMLENVHNLSTEEYPLGISIDKRTNKLYWSDYGVRKVFRSNLDGTNKEEIIGAGLLDYAATIAILYNNVSSVEKEKVLLNDRFLLFPNPAGNHLYLKFNNVNNIHLPTTASIHSIDGRCVQSFQINRLNMELSINHLEKGIYILKIQFTDGSLAVEKFIKS